MVTDHPAHDPLHGHIPVETVQGHFGGQFRPHGFKGCCHIDMGLGADEAFTFRKDSCQWLSVARQKPFRCSPD